MSKKPKKSEQAAENLAEVKKEREPRKTKKTGPIVDLAKLEREAKKKKKVERKASDGMTDAEKIVLYRKVLKKIKALAKATLIASVNGGRRVFVESTLCD